MFGVEAHHACEGTLFNLQKLFHVKNCGLRDCVLKENLFLLLFLTLAPTVTFVQDNDAVG